jgi:hypothetical protein
MTWIESETLEFKASFSEWKEAVQAVCAFANANGAFVTTFFKFPPNEESSGEGVNEGVLLTLIRSAPDLRLPQLAARLDAAPKSVERWLASLRRRGEIEFHGSPKTGGYRATSAVSVAVGS